MRFLYKAKNSKGEVVTGTVNADTEYEAEKILVGHDLVAEEIIPEKGRSFPVFQFASRITVKDRAVFARQLATMISAGLPLTKAVTIVAAQSRTERIKNICYAAFKDLEEGYSFSYSLSRHPEMFDRVFVSVINSGETTGKLDVVLEQLAKQLENDNNFISQVKGVLYYPAFIFLALMVIGTYMLVVIIPQLKSVFNQAGSDALPAATRVLVFISDLFVNAWWMIFLGAAVLVIAIRIWAVSSLGAEAVSRLQITLPGLKKLSEGLYVSRFSRSMEMLVAAGVPLLDSLRTSSSLIKNEIYGRSILNMITKVERGVPLSAELSSNPIFPRILGQMVAVGEETGQLDKVLGKVAEYYEAEVSETVKTLTSLIEPVVLVIIGLGVAFLVFAVLVPIYNLARLQ